MHRLLYRKLPKDHDQAETASLVPVETIQAEVSIARVEPTIESAGDSKAQAELDDLMVDDRLDPLIAEESALRSDDIPASSADQRAPEEQPSSDVEVGKASENSLVEDAGYGTKTGESPAWSDKERMVEDGEDVVSPESMDDVEDIGRIDLESVPTCRRSKEVEVLLALPDRWVMVNLKDSFANQLLGQWI